MPGPTRRKPLHPGLLPDGPGVGSRLRSRDETTARRHCHRRTAPRRLRRQRRVIADPYRPRDIEPDSKPDPSDHPESRADRDRETGPRPPDRALRAAWPPRDRELGCRRGPSHGPCRADECRHVACTINALARPQLVNGNGSVLINGAAAAGSPTLTLAAGAVVKALVQDDNYCGPARRRPSPWRSSSATGARCRFARVTDGRRWCPAVLRLDGCRGDRDAVLAP